ncbi:hypothetical protein FRX31_012694 [Thalictrum thalictroides]|uniref:Uncharacterized protein n=1 Tax=Thalictrum thalictroides TaxID=46969 RepID=A0A7J6WK30_THATH|nr:hypothetical protein FRX31_012694 [Thalictrum thalictroides]
MPLQDGELTGETQWLSYPFMGSDKATSCHLAFMTFLHPNLGVELPERSYGTDCRIYLPDNPTSRLLIYRIHYLMSLFLLLYLDGGVKL